RQRPELLEPRLSRLGTEELLMAAARLRMSEEPREAAAWMEQAIALSESPDGSPGSAELLLAAARGSADRAQAAAWIASANVDAEVEADWRMDVLGPMIAAGDPEASAWLNETARKWLERASNSRFVSKFAAALGGLPPAMMERVAARAQETSGPKARLLAAAL